MGPARQPAGPRAPAADHHAGVPGGKLLVSFCFFLSFFNFVSKFFSKYFFRTFFELFNSIFFLFFSSFFLSLFHSRFTSFPNKTTHPPHPQLQRLRVDAGGDEGGVGPRRRYLLGDALQLLFLIEIRRLCRRRHQQQRRRAGSFSVLSVRGRLLGPPPRARLLLPALQELPRRRDLGPRRK